MYQKIFNITNLTLLVALSLSTVAAYYSIVGLTAIFAGAVIPIIIMGSILEIGKITTTVWLRKYWDKCGLLLKSYLVFSVVVIALLTSMGIFGFLSRAHIEQGVPTGDVAAKVSLIEEKIKTERDNIDIAKKALVQMDDQITQLLARGNDTQNAERAVQIRRQQAKERTQLQQEISKAQQEIAKLNEEKAPLATQLRKIEVEVGPIKYIAALIYGDTVEHNMLEKAVRYVIILIIIVFDPLALALVLAANNSKIYDKENKVEEEKQIEQPKETVIEPTKEEPTEEKPKDDDSDILKKHPYLLKNPFKIPFDFIREKPLVYKEESIVKEIVSTAVVQEPEVVIEPEKIPEPIKPTTVKVETDNITRENPLIDLGDGYVLFNGKNIKKEALKEIEPELFLPSNLAINNFGNKFPKYATNNDIFIRIDLLPTSAYKFSSGKWIEIEKQSTHMNEEYIRALIGKIDTGNYEVTLLTEAEKNLITQYLKNDNTGK